jgi:hypothetical protein
MVPSLSAQNTQRVKIGKDFMYDHGYIKSDLDVDEWARPEFLEQAATQVLEEEWERRSWRRRRLLVGGMLAIGAYKMSQQQADQVQQHTGVDPEELTDPELTQPMDELGIDKQAVTDADKDAE